MIIYRENNNTSRYIVLKATPQGGSETTITGTTCSSSYLAHGYSLDPNKSYSITLQGTGTGSDQQDVYVYAIKLFKGETCADPKASIIDDANGFVGDAIDLEFSTLNTSDTVWTIKKGEADAVENTDYVWADGNFKPLVTGTFVITATQEKDATFCAVEGVSVTLTINEKNPVTSCSIEGPTSAFVGAELTYTATAEGATTIEWYLDGAKQEGNSETFNYTAVKGSHSIFAIAYNQFNTEENKAWSEAVNVKVTNPSGELIKAVLGGGTSATVTGVIGGSFNTNLGSGKYKLDKGVYAGVTLASGSFQEGDTVVVVMTTAGSNYPCLFADKD